MTKKPEPQVVKSKKNKKKGSVLTYDESLGVEDRFFQGLPVLKILGSYFYFAPRRHQKSIPDYREISKWRRKHPESIQDRPFDIEPSLKYGWPGELAYKVWTVYEKRLSDTWGANDGLIFFSCREIARLAGRIYHGGSQAEEIDNVIWQLHDTKIHLWNIDGDGIMRDTDYHLLDRVRLTDTNTGRVLGYGLQAPEKWRQFYLTRKLFMTMSWNRFKGLSPGAHRNARFLNQAFATLYSRNNNSEFEFVKNYAALLEEWMGGASRHKAPSLIKRQLGRVFDPLKKVKLIHTWRVVRNKKCDGYNVIIKPGEGFFEDYHRIGMSSVKKFEKPPKPNKKLLRNQKQNFDNELLEIWQYAQYKIFARDDVSDINFTTADKSFLTTLLKEHGLEIAKAFIDYSKYQLPLTGFDSKIKTIKGISIYEEEFKAYKKREQQQLMVDAEQVKVAEEKALKIEYETYLDIAYQAHIKTIDPDVLEAEYASIQSGRGIKNNELNKLNQRAIIHQHRTQIIEHLNVYSFEKWLEHEYKN